VEVDKKTSHPDSTIKILGRQKKKVKPLLKTTDSSTVLHAPVDSLITVHKYYIIVKSQLPLSELKKIADGLVKQGYQDTKILKKDTKNRISIYDFENKSKADSALRVVKRTFKDAWILKK